MGASLVLALQSLHDRSICYRDLKPENILLTSGGYLKLIDFGTAVKLRGMTFTLVGTPHYMAPEVIMGDGYGLSCDVWSLGICLHEFMCGPLPFGNSSDSHYQVFIDILTASLSLPLHLKDPTSIQILKGFLYRCTEKRLGCCIDGWEDVRKHNFFRDFSFEKLLCGSLKPPWVPNVPIDTEQNDSDSSGLSCDGESEDESDNDGWDKVF